jgi:hypothetical protein
MKGFKAGSVINFIMSVEEPLGPLTHMRIWHDNSGSGKSKSWYLNTVCVIDLQNKEKYVFCIYFLKKMFRAEIIEISNSLSRQKCIVCFVQLATSYFQKICRLNLWENRLGNFWQCQSAL